MKRKLVMLAGLALAGGLLLSKPVLGVDCTTTWDGGGGNLSWHTAGNWSTDQVPGAADWVCIPDLTPNVTITHSTGTTSILGIDSFETLSISGGTLNLTDSLNPSTTSVLSLAGTLGGAGDLSIGSSFVWSSGTITGTGDTIVASGASASITSASDRFITEGRLLRIDGTGVWAQTSRILIGSNSGTAAFEVGGSLDIQGNVTLAHYYGSVRARNNGTITKSISTGTAGFDLPFTNDGAVEVLAGTFRHGGSGSITSAGTYGGAVGATIEWAGSGINTLTNAAPVSSSQAVVRVTSGTWTVGGGVSNSSFNLVGGTLNFNGVNDLASLTMSSGTLGGTGTARINGSMTWTAGTMTQSGTTLIAPTGTASISGTSDRFITEGRLLRIEGSATWSGPSRVLLGSNAGTAAFEVAGTLDVTSNSTLLYYYGSTRAKNTGVVRKTTSTGTAAFDLPFTNDGAVEVVAGTFRHGGLNTLSHGGTYTGAGGTTIDLSGSGTNTLTNAAPIVASQATVRVSGGTWTTNGTVNTASVSGTGGTSNFNGTTTLGSLTVTGGTQNFGTSVQVTNASVSNGTLGGVGSVDVTGTLTWSSGTLTGAGTLTVLPGATANITSANDRFITEGRLLRINGSGVWSGSRILLGSNSGTAAAFEVGGTLEVQGNSTLVNYYGTSRARNTGLVRTNTAGTVGFDIPFTNDGAVEVAAGTFRHGGFNTLSHSGTYTGAAGTVVELAGSGVNTLTNPAPVSASQATLKISGGTWTINGMVNTSGINGVGGTSNFNGTTTLGTLTITGGTQNFGTSVQVTNASVSNGTLGGVGSVDVSGTFTWSSGTLTGAGTLTVLPGATANITSANDRFITEGRLLRINGSGVWSGSRILLGSNSGTAAAFEVGGTLEVQGNSTLVNYYGTSRARNTGLVRTNTAGTVGFDIPFTNDGAVEVAAGTFRHGGFNTLSHSGTYTGAAGTIIDLGGNGINTLTNPAPISASQATLRVSGATWRINGTVSTTAINGIGGTSNFNGATTLGTLTISGGTHNFNTGVDVGSASVSNGTLGGTGVVNVTGSFGWSSGTLTGSGTLLVAPGATASITTTSDRFVSEGRLLRVEGSGTWAGSSRIFLGSNAGTAALEVAGSLDITGNSSLVYYYGSVRAKNTGSIRKTTSTGTATIGIPFDNWGTLSVESGTLHASSFQSFNNTTKTLLRGTYNILGTFKFNAANIITNAASITLDGAAASIVDETNLDGLRGLATNSATGSLVARNGRIVTAPGQITNAGLVEVGAASRIAATGRYLQTGGMTRLADATSVLRATGSSVDIQGGVLEGIGTAEPMVENSGTVTPGLSPGTLTTVDYTQASGGLMIAEIAGTAPGSFDSLEMTGAATIDGTLRVVTAPSYSPQLGDTFRILNFASSTGTFADVEGRNLGQGLYYRVDYNPTNVSLVVGDGLVSVDDVSVAEGDAGTTVARFTVTSPSGLPGSVEYATSNISAVAGTDYMPTSGIVSFLPGETTKVVDVPVMGDVLDEPNETFRLTLTNALSLTLGHAEGRGTIQDDDVPVEVSVSDVTVAEANTTVAAVFDVSLSSASGHTISVDYATANRTAVSPADYSASSGTLTFAPGETSKTLSINVIGDLTDEFDETFFLDLSSPVNANISDGRGEATVQDDDAPPSITVYDASVGEGDVGSSTAYPLLQLSRVSGKAISVRLTTSDGAATSPDDYTPTVVTATFSPGQAHQYVAIPITPDIIDEPNESFNFSLSEAVNVTVPDPTGNVLIIDDDAPPTISVYDSYVFEGDSGIQTLTMTVALSDRSAFEISVDHATSDGSATAGTDYTPVTGTLTFLPGQTSKQVSIPVVTDLLDEADETVFVDLSNAVNAPIARGRGTGTIYDDDAPPSISISDASVAEGNSAMQFTVQLSDQSGQMVSVDYATADDGATSADYVSASGTLAFLPGERTKTVSVQVLGDELDEFDEFIRMNLSSPTNGVFGRSQGRGRIIDDDAEVSVSIADLEVIEPDDSPIDAAFVVSLSAPSGKTVSLNVATAGGTATGGADYSNVAAVIELQPGQTQTVVPVSVLPDTNDEPNETFSLVMSSVSNAVADNDGVGTIIDNDPDCTILGTPGDDLLLGTPAADVICGLEGNDVIYGLEGDDILVGGSGDDTLIGGAGDDLARGQDGSDKLFGGLGLDDLYGDLGDDNLDVRDLQAGDLADGGSGTDACESDEGDEVRSCP